MAWLRKIFAWPPAPRSLGSDAVGWPENRLVVNDSGFLMTGDNTTFLETI